MPPNRASHRSSTWDPRAGCSWSVSHCQFMFIYVVLASFFCVGNAFRIEDARILSAASAAATMSSEAAADGLLGGVFRRGSPSFRLGRRSTSSALDTADDNKSGDVEEVGIPFWRVRRGTPSFRLGKRRDVEEENVGWWRFPDDENIGESGKEIGRGDALSLHGNYKLDASSDAADFDNIREMKKRAPGSSPSFRLGKRDVQMLSYGGRPAERSASEEPTFRLGRGSPSFRLGKRAMNTPTFRLGRQSSSSSRFSHRPVIVILPFYFRHVFDDGNGVSAKTNANGEYRPEIYDDETTTVQEDFDSDDTDLGEDDDEAMERIDHALSEPELPLSTTGLNRRANGMTLSTILSPSKSAEFSNDFDHSTALNRLDKRRSLP